MRQPGHVCDVEKVFWFFFSKKNMLSLICCDAPWRPYPARARWHADRPGLVRPADGGLLPVAQRADGNLEMRREGVLARVKTGAASRSPAAMDAAPVSDGASGARSVAAREPATRSEGTVTAATSVASAGSHHAPR
jgi:hypothetical protein